MNKYYDRIKGLLENILLCKAILADCTDTHYIEKGNAHIIKSKRELRAIYRQQEQEYQDANKPFAERVYYPVNDCESKLHFYNIALGARTREEALNELYECCATNIYSPYDCTGLWFTQWFMCARIPANVAGEESVWRVCEKMGVDV